MTVFETDPRLALRSGIAAIAACAVVFAVAVGAAVALPITLLTVLCVLIALGAVALVPWLVYNLRNLTRLSYALDRNAFVIRCGDLSEVVPMGDVQHLVPAKDITSRLKVRRGPLPGWWIGTGRHASLPGIRFYANAPLDRQVVLVTPETGYAISPYDLEAFQEAFEQRHNMRPTQAVQAARLEPPIMRAAFLRDRVARGLLVIALLVNIALFAAAAARFPALSGSVPLHFNVLGAADRFGSPSQVFLPAVIGLAVLLVNAVLGAALYRAGDRLAAYLAWGGAIVIQTLFVVAVITIGFTPA